VKDAAGHVHQEGKIGSTRRELPVGVPHGFHRDSGRRRMVRYRNLVLKQMVQMKNRVSGY
jgi:hypothetical protein